jgi:hypothetical protein
VAREYFYLPDVQKSAAKVQKQAEEKAPPPVLDVQPPAQETKAAPSDKPEQAKDGGGGQKK